MTKLGLTTWYLQIKSYSACFLIGTCSLSYFVIIKVIVRIVELENTFTMNIVFPFWTCINSIVSCVYTILSCVHAIPSCVNLILLFILKKKVSGNVFWVDSKYWSNMLKYNKVKILTKFTTRQTFNDVNFLLYKC